MEIVFLDNVIERTIRQKHVVPNTLNYGCPGFDSKFCATDGNSSVVADR
jgi:hypothetical protein